MSQAAEQLNELVQRYRVADDSNDIEGRVRAATELTTFVVQLKNRDNARAWAAIDRKRAP